MCIIIIIINISIMSRFGHETMWTKKSVNEDKIKVFNIK